MISAQFKAVLCLLRVCYG